MTQQAPSQQHPIPSGFSRTSTTADVIKGIDLTGKTAIVTGGYSGLGIETARVLRAAGARVIVPSRDVPRAEAALAGITDAEVWHMDLLDPESISAFGERFLEEGAPLHLLINNAAIMACPLGRDSRGNELQFSTNHLGHFQLVQHLWPALVAARGARVVNVSSRGHRFSPVVLEDLNFERRPYDPWASYGQSKTANVLHAVEIDARGREHGIRAFALHPGGIITNLAKYMSQEDLRRAGAVDDQGKPIIDEERGIKTVEQGAATQVWCAVSPQLEGLGGLYCEDVDVAVRVSPEDAEKMHANLLDRTMRGVMPYAVDKPTAERLWALSEELIG
jgi:NAD(P)-dependent dehydrogenase (short-subunit alcohol dehydrogenase family)